MPPAPDFSGPFAGEFLTEWNDAANSDFVRSVLEDGAITDQEWAEVGMRLEDCLAAKGIDFKGFDSSGGYSVTSDLSGQMENTYMGQCELESGEHPLAYLRTQMSTNPDNIPVGQAMAECLVRLHVVAPGYTSEDYLRDAPSMTFPYLDPKTGQAGFWKCNADPIGARP